MQTLFNLASAITQGVIKFPEWDYLRHGLRENLSNVLQYYRGNPTAVKGDHLLVSLLQSITVPQSLQIERYVSNVESIALHVAAALKMTSPIMVGQTFDGVFYGKGNTEIILAHAELFDIYHAEKHWENLQPVKVIKHPQTDLSLPILDGKHPSNEKGLAVIAINIPMLAVMYRGFRNKEREIASVINENQRSLMMFIRMYVLPNMLMSHLDLTVFNRIVALKSNELTASMQKVHTFYLQDLSNRMDACQLKILESLAKVTKNFNGTLHSIPGIVQEDMRSVLKLPDIAPTRQVAWALVIARLKPALFLFMTAGRDPGTKSRSDVNTIQRSLSYLQMDRVLQGKLPVADYESVKGEIETLLSWQTDEG